MTDEPFPTKPIRELDSREFRFVEEYVCGGPRECGNAYRSAVRAGYTHDTANVHAGAWVRNPSGNKPDDKPWEGNPKPWIWDAVQARRAEVAAQMPVDKEWVIREMRKLAGASAAAFTRMTSSGDPYIDISDMTHDEMAALAEVQVEDYFEGRGEDARLIKRIKVKNYDKRAAVEGLGKMLGIATKVMHSNDPENPMPGGGTMAYDITKLTEIEARQLFELLKKAAPDSAVPPVTATRPDTE